MQPAPTDKRWRAAAILCHHACCCRAGKGTGKGEQGSCSAEVVIDRHCEAFVARSRQLSQSPSLGGRSSLAAISLRNELVWRDAPLAGLLDAAGESSPIAEARRNACAGEESLSKVMPMLLRSLSEPKARIPGTSRLLLCRKRGYRGGAPAPTRLPLPPPPLPQGARCCPLRRPRHPSCRWPWAA